MENNLNHGFTFYDNFWKAIEKLPEQQQKDICWAACKYAMTGKMPDASTDALSYAIVTSWKMAIDNSVERINNNLTKKKPGARGKITNEELKAELDSGKTLKEIADEHDMQATSLQRRIKREKDKPDGFRF